MTGLINPENSLLQLNSPRAVHMVQQYPVAEHSTILEEDEEPSAKHKAVESNIILSSNTLRSMTPSNEVLEPYLSKIKAQKIDMMLLRKLIRISRDSNLAKNKDHAVEVWGSEGERFYDLMSMLLKLIENDMASELKEYILLLLKELIANQTEFATLHAEELVNKFMICRSSNSNDISSTAEEAMDEFLKVVNNKISLSALVEYIEAELIVKASIAADSSAAVANPPQSVRSSPIAAAFSALSLLVSKMPGDDIDDERVSQMFHIATNGLNDDLPEIRKSAVELLVVLDAIPGLRSEGYLQQLTAPQLKLFTTYKEKKEKQDVIR